MSKTWLKLILERIAVTSPEPATHSLPQDAVGTHDYIVGRLGDDHTELRKLHSLMLLYCDEVLDIMSEIKSYSQSGFYDDLPKLNTRLNVTIKKRDTLIHLFWVSVCDEFPILWEKDLMAIREDWQIVWIETSESGFSTLAEKSIPVRNVNWN